MIKVTKQQITKSIVCQPKEWENQAKDFHQVGFWRKTKVGSPPAIQNTIHLERGVLLMFYFLFSICYCCFCLFFYFKFYLLFSIFHFPSIFYFTILKKKKEFFFFNCFPIKILRVVEVLRIRHLRLEACNIIASIVFPLDFTSLILDIDWFSSV